MPTRSLSEYIKHEKSQCHANSAPYIGDRLENPIFNGGGFIGQMTGSECAAECTNPANVDGFGRPCVAFEHSSQDYAAVANCALAWACDYTEKWSGGAAYIRAYMKYTKHEKSQCQANFAPYNGDRLDNPIFNGGGFIGQMTGSECAAECTNPANVDGFG